MNLIPIGSCVKVKNETVLIAGYGLSKQNEDYEIIYYCLPYPTGFLNSNSVFAIKEKNIGDMLFLADKNEEAVKFIDELGSLYESMIKYGAENCETLFADFTNFAKEKSEEETNE